MKDSFSPDFYATAATVIPVLYLALTLQGSTFEGLIKQWRASLLDFYAEATIKSTSRWIGLALIGIAAASFIFAGIAGDYLAFLALYQRKSSARMKSFIFTSIVLLIIVVMVGPVVRFLLVYLDPWIKSFKRDSESDAKPASGPSSSED